MIYWLGISDNTNGEPNNSNNKNNTIISYNNLKHSNVNIKNNNELTSHAKELMNIYENLDLRKQIKLLSYAFELESQKKMEGNDLYGKNQY